MRVCVCAFPHVRECKHWNGWKCSHTHTHARKQYRNNDSRRMHTCTLAQSHFEYSCLTERGKFPSFISKINPFLAIVLYSDRWKRVGSSDIWESPGPYGLEGVIRTECKTMVTFFFFNDDRVKKRSIISGGLLIPVARKSNKTETVHFTCESSACVICACEGSSICQWLSRKWRNEEINKTL